MYILNKYLDMEGQKKESGITGYIFKDYGKFKQEREKSAHDAAQTHFTGSAVCDHTGYRDFDFDVRLGQVAAFYDDEG